MDRGRGGVFADVNPNLENHMLLLTRVPRRAYMLVAALAATFGLAAAAGSAQASEPLPTGTPLEFVFEHSGKVANVAEANPNAGAPLIQWPDANGGYVNDQFKLSQAPASMFGPNRYYIQPMHALNRYVGVNCPVFNQLACSIELMAPSLGNSTVWHAEPTGDGYLHLVSQKNNQAMNVEGASLANGARLVTWPRQMYPASPWHNDHILIRAGS
jgi:hypothetical protein